jgi:hypothetical protein
MDCVDWVIIPIQYVQSIKFRKQIWHVNIPVLEQLDQLDHHRPPFELRGIVKLSELRGIYSSATCRWIINVLSPVCTRFFVVFDGNSALTAGVTHWA